MNSNGGMSRGCPPGMMPGRGMGIGGVPVGGNVGSNGMGRGNPGMPPNMPSGGMPGIRGGRGGGPMRGSAVNAGRMRPAPY